MRASMSDTDTNIDDLFNDDDKATAAEPPAGTPLNDDELAAANAPTNPDAGNPDAAPPSVDFAGNVAEFKAAATDIDDDELARLAAGDSRKGVREAASAEIERRSEPQPAAKSDGDPIDTAVRIRRLDWECECGNTNTHELTRCGKCNTARYR